MIKFIPYYGPIYSLKTNENYLNFRWLFKNTLILFSVTQQGNGAICHLYSDKRGLRYLKQAVLDWNEYVFDYYNWCKMIIAIIEKPSIERLVKYCGFKKIITINNKLIYTKEK